MSDLDGGDLKAPFFGLPEDSAPVFLTLDDSERAYRAFPTEETVYRALQTEDDPTFLAPATLRSAGHKDLWMSSADSDSLSSDALRTAPVKSLYEAASSGPDIPLEPEYVEPWSSFETEDSGTLKNVYEMLLSIGIQCNYNVAKYKIKGTFPSLDGAQGKFSVFLYKRSAKSFVLEVVRRSGDILLFNSLFKQLKTALGVDTSKEVLPSLDDLPAIKELSLTDLMSS
jgi:hypothetical protein